MSLAFPQLTVLVIVAVVIVSASRWLFSQISNEYHAGAALRPLLSRKRLAVATVIVLVCLVRLALLKVTGIPEPAIADEFSYLFMADTFAAGSVANPTHPYWPHFESLFVLSRPTYSSIYPVAQGVILAAGTLLTGNPWSGVLLSAAAMCGCFCWMLQAWVPPRWALLGALLAAMQFGLNSYWMNSYWGGAHAAIGGSLVLGSFRRLELRKRWIDPALLGLGLGLLANSRPYEGSALALTLFVLFLLQPRLQRRHILLPATIVMAVFALGMLYYFNTVTGSPIRMPAQVYIEQHAVVPMFIWQGLRKEPAYSTPEVRKAMFSFVPDFDRYSTAAGIAQTTISKILTGASFFLGPLLLVPLLTLPWLIRDHRMRPLLFCIAAGLFATALTVPFQPHYLAPFAPAFLAVTVQSLRRLWVARRYGNTLGDYLVPSAPLLILFLLIVGLRSPVPRPLLADRAAVADTLTKSGGKHVVFIHYGEEHILANEWVHNSPRIDNQAIVWARERTLEENSALMRYFTGRKAWLIDPDQHPPELKEQIYE